VLGTLLVLGIGAANLLVPIGRVLVSWGPFSDHEIALREGRGEGGHLRSADLRLKARIRTTCAWPGKPGA
jgi:hypothetical protein